MKKTHKVIMLNTNEISNLGIPLDVLQYDKDGFDPHTIQNKELYIISDDEIKEGDWVYDTIEDVEEGSKIIEKAINDAYLNPKAGYKKIVATTDKSLYPKCDGKCATNECICLLPQIPESFIQAYIKAYNEGKAITEVDLELCFTNGGYSNTNEPPALELMLTTDNYVVVVDKSVVYNDRWIDASLNPDEARIYTKADMEKAFEAGASCEFNPVKNPYFQDWIKKYNKTTEN
jgi:hypothetical protein